MHNPFEFSVTPEKEKGVDWKEFWKNEGLNSPSRKDVFPNQEDEKMTNNEIIEKLNQYFEMQGSNLDNMTGIDAEEFPEIIDVDIRDVCIELNKLPFLKIREGCGGHEFDSNGEISNRGYSEPYLAFYAEEKNLEFIKFLENVNKKVEEFLDSKSPGIDNVVFNRGEIEWPIKTDGIKMYSYGIEINPTKEWCSKNNKRFIERPSLPKMYYDWCDEKGFEYSDDEESESRKKWYKEKEEYWEKEERFLSEYGEYFRSKEVGDLRDEFFKIFISL
ncbi:MAG: hypothetical protein OEV93_02490 [Candidatus Moranbacteria bacterium]|nr:hypothetical protein [Candidatus Moranbacteria bacterium]